MFARLRLWRMRGRLVRVHLEGSDPSVQGLYRGRRGGHYLLDVPHIVSGPRDPEPLTGFVAIPAGRVLFLQVMPS